MRLALFYNSYRVCTQHTHSRGILCIVFTLSIEIHFNQFANIEYAPNSFQVRSISHKHGNVNNAVLNTYRWLKIGPKIEEKCPEEEFGTMGKWVNKVISIIIDATNNVDVGTQIASTLTLIPLKCLRGEKPTIPSNDVHIQAENFTSISS